MNGDSPSSNADAVVETRDGGTAGDLNTCGSLLEVPSEEALEVPHGFLDVPLEEAQAQEFPPGV